MLILLEDHFFLYYHNYKFIKGETENEGKKYPENNAE